MWSDQVHPSSSGLAYHRSGEGPAVLLLHGIPGSSSSWRQVASLLPGQLDVVVPDLLGFGSSARPARLGALHAAAQAEALQDLVDELGLGPATVVGHDFGGPVALELRARRPAAVTAVGLLASNVFPDTPVPFPLTSVTWPVLGPAMARVIFSRTALRAMLRRGVGDGAVAIDEPGHLGDERQRAAIATIFAGSLRGLADLYSPVQAELSVSRGPVLVGWGDRDPFFPPTQGERTAREANTSLHLYTGAGHFLPQEQPAPVARDIAALAAATR